MEDNLLEDSTTQTKCEQQTVLDSRCIESHKLTAAAVRLQVASDSNQVRSAPIAVETVALLVAIVTRALLRTQLQCTAAGPDSRVIIKCIRIVVVVNSRSCGCDRVAISWCCSGCF